MKPHGVGDGARTPPPASRFHHEKLNDGAALRVETMSAPTKWRGTDDAERIAMTVKVEKTEARQAEERSDQRRVFGWSVLLAALAMGGAFLIFVLVT